MSFSSTVMRRIRTTATTTRLTTPIIPASIAVPSVANHSGVDWMTDKVVGAGCDQYMVGL